MSSARDTALYDDAADAWWSEDIRWVRTLRNMVPARLRFFDPLVGDWTGRDVLDLGCAGGFMAEAIARRGARVTGIDPAAQAIGAARRHAEAEGLAIDYREGVGEALPFADASFDHVVCVDVLEHVTDLDRVTAEVARVLRPGGLFLFDTINRTLLARLGAVFAAERVLRLLPKGTHDPALFIKPAELTATLTKHGLAPGRMTGLGPTGIGRGLTPRWGLVPMRAIIYIGSARKG